MADPKIDQDALNQLMAQLRPRLHRYCARMVGSVFDGEDIVQDALAKAAQALPSYWLVQASHVSLGEGGWGISGWLVVAGWSVFLRFLAIAVHRRDTERV